MSGVIIAIERNKARKGGYGMLREGGIICFNKVISLSKNVILEQKSEEKEGVRHSDI